MGFYAERQAFKWIMTNKGLTSCIYAASMTRTAYWCDREIRFGADAKREREMGIDNLTKAADAAGYAMATQEDETEFQPMPAPQAAEASRSLVVASHYRTTTIRDLLQAASATVRSYLGTSRAPA